MYDKEMSNEELSRYRYPNLMAEIVESGYSICTLAEHMGLPGQRKENDSEVWDKLNSEESILTDEALGLSRLFSVKLEYLFCHELETLCGKSIAYWRWIERNQNKERELEQIQIRDMISKELLEKPYLLEFLKVVITWSEEELHQTMIILDDEKEGAAV